MGDTTAASSTTPPTQAPRLDSGIDTNNSTATDLNSFILSRIDVYRQKKWRDADLSEYYAEDFCNFTTEHFEQCDKDTIRDLRDHLRQHGVYVRKGRGCPIAKELHAAIETELEWPEDNPDNPRRQCIAVNQTPSPRNRNQVVSQSSDTGTISQSYGFETVGGFETVELNDELSRGLAARFKNPIPSDLSVIDKEMKEAGFDFTPEFRASVQASPFWSAFVESWDSIDWFGNPVRGGQ